MSAALILASYEGHPMAFDGEGWFNATSAAAKFGKEPAQWLRLPTTAEYREALARRYGKFTDVRASKARADRGGGTWLHPKLAVPFARWLDLDFALWADEQIDNLLRGKLDKVKLRHEAASSYKVMSQILQMARADAGKESKPHHFMNEAKLVNWALNGQFAGLDRDALSAVELALLANLEERNAILIARGVDYQARKPVLENHALDWRSTHQPRIHASAANDPNGLEK